MWNEVNYTELKVCNATGSVSGHSMMDFHSHSKRSQVLSGLPIAEDPQNPTFRGTIFDSTLFHTSIRKKTKKMMLRSLRKPNYQFWSSGTAFLLSCHSLMATWLHVTSLRVMNVEADFRMHVCVGFFLCCWQMSAAPQKIFQTKSFFHKTIHHNGFIPTRVQNWWSVMNLAATWIPLVYISAHPFFSMFLSPALKFCFRNGWKLSQVISW